MFRNLTYISVLSLLTSSMIASADTVQLKLTPLGEVVPIVVDKSADDGLLGNDPALYDSIDYQEADNGVWATAETFFAGQNSFGATSAIDGVEAVCPLGIDCGVSAGGNAEMRFRKKDAGVDVLPFTITAFDMAIAGSAAASVLAQIKVNGDLNFDVDFFLNSSGLDDSDQICDGIFAPCITGTLETGLFPQYARNSFSSFFDEARGRIFTADTYTGVIDVSNIDPDEDILLNWKWDTFVYGEGALFHGYARFQDPFGPIQFDFSNFVGEEQPVQPSAVPLPAGFWLLSAALGVFGLAGRFEKARPKG